MPTLQLTGVNYAQKNEFIILGRAFVRRQKSFGSEAEE
jgi:hypothetical protein